MATAGNVFELWDVGFYLDPNNTGLPPPWVTPDYASELAACQRYWRTIGTALVSGYHAAGGTILASLPVSPTMRAAPAAAVVAPGYSNSSGLTLSSSFPTVVNIQAIVTAAGGAFATGTVNMNARM
jgi:hypothetical protein